MLSIFQILRLIIMRKGINNRMNVLEKIMRVITFVTLTFMLFPSISAVHAATDASFSLVVPNNGTLVQGCFYSADIIMRTGSNEVNAADIRISYDPSRIEVIDAIQQTSGTQIKTGNAFETYFGNMVDDQNGKIRLTGASFDHSVTGEKVFGTILFRSKAQAESGAFTIDFYGSGRTDDSNIAISQSSQDALGSVTNAALSFLPGACVNDKDAPVITFVTPASHASNIPIDSQVIIELSDDLSGVDLNTLEIFINGNRYTASHQDITIEQLSGRLRVQINQRNVIPANIPSSIVVDVRDNTGNLRQSYMTFNFGVLPSTVVTQIPPRPTNPIIDTIAPMITFSSPLARQTIADGTDVIFQMSDEGSGIRKESLRVFVNEKSYASTDIKLEMSGTENEYMVRISDAFVFPKKVPSFLTIFVTDQNGNAAAESILFNIPDSMVQEEQPKPVLCIQEPEGEKRALWRNAPWFKQIADSEEMLYAYTPRIMKAFVSELGLLGIITLLLTLPMQIRLFTLFMTTFLSGGFLALISSRFFSKGKQHCTIHDATSGKPVRFASIKCISMDRNQTVHRTISDDAGKFILQLPQGAYTLVIDKYGYIPLIQEITLHEEGFVDDNFVMHAVNIQFVSQMVWKILILAMLLSVVNLFYTFTSLSVTLAVVLIIFITVFTIVIIINMKTKQKNNSSV